MEPEPVATTLPPDWTTFTTNDASAVEIANRAKTNAPQGASLMDAIVNLLLLNTIPKGRVARQTHVIEETPYLGFL
jgi:hypothetical protein